jgi:hypothetical protein
MKITFLILLLFCTLAAFGQSAAVTPSQPVVIQVPDHPQHAEPHAMAQEKPIVGGGGYTVEHGERPLWDFGLTLAEQPSLGDVARAYRKEKLTGKKAEIVLEKQGS